MGWYSRREMIYSRSVCAIQESATKGQEAGNKRELNDTLGASRRGVVPKHLGKSGVKSVGLGGALCGEFTPRQLPCWDSSSPARDPDPQLRSGLKRATTAACESAILCPVPRLTVRPSWTVRLHTGYQVTTSRREGGKKKVKLTSAAPCTASIEMLALISLHWYRYDMIIVGVGPSSIQLKHSPQDIHSPRLWSIESSVDAPGRIPRCVCTALAWWTE